MEMMSNDDDLKARSEVEVGANMVSMPLTHLFVTDVWTSIFGFLGTPDAQELARCSKQMIHSASKSPVAVTIRGRLYDSKQKNNWRKIQNAIEKYFPKCEKITLFETDCDMEFMQAMLQMCRGKAQLSISKMFKLVSDLSTAKCRHLALCDILWQKHSFLRNYAFLNTLVLSNNTFETRIELCLLFANLPAKLHVLALGGCRNASPMDPHLLPFMTLDIEVNHRADLVIETTFLHGETRRAIMNIFPNALIIDFLRDTVDQLECCFQFIKHLTGEVRFKSEMLSCASSNHLRTLLHISCMENDYAKCQWLLKNSARVNARDSSGCTALHRVVQVKATEHTLRLIELLLEFDADCLIKNQSLESPIMLTAAHGNAEGLSLMLRTLRQNGHTPEQLTRICDHSKYTLLQLAIISNSPRCCELIINYILGNNAPGAIFENPIDSASSNLLSAYINHQTRYGVTAVHLAYRFPGMSDIAERLKYYGGDPNRLDHDGNSADDYRSNKASAKSGRGRKRR